MTYDYYGERTPDSPLNELVEYIEKNPHYPWNFLGIKVELDPTVVWSDQFVLVRWYDELQGFNDKHVVSTLDEFKSLFRPWYQ